MPSADAFWDAAFAKALSLRTAVQPVWAFEVPPSLDWDSRGVGGPGETHSTLINTRHHYLSHRGEFNTTLLSRGALVDFHGCCICLQNRIKATTVSVYVSVPAYFPPVLVRVCVAACLHVRMLYVGLDS